MSRSEQICFRVIEDYRAGKISRKEAAALLGISERTVTRRAKKVREKGLRGVKHGNVGKTPTNRLQETLQDEMLRLSRDVYASFNLSHRLEMIEKEHGLKVSYGTFYSWCRQAGLGKGKKRRRGKARYYRERMANEGLMLQMDGSHHPWNGKDTWCLIALIDDATSDIPAAQFHEGETTLGCMKTLRSVIERKGIPEIIYTDQAGWTGATEKRKGFSQFARACDELGIRIITTSSPESKGRIERAWRTIQDRLVPELAHYDIKSMLDANRYLDQTFLPNYWRERNTVVPRKATTRYRALPRHTNLGEVFCLKYKRVVRRDHTVLHDAKVYKIVDRSLGSLAGKGVSVHVYENGPVAVFYGHKRLEIVTVTPPRRQWEPRRA